jgi:ribosome-binding protein aMBF1 (putative translation factor)
MKKINKNPYLTDPSFWENYLKKELKDPEFKKYYDYYGKQLEIAYQILKLRKKKKMSQLQLAKKIGTKQSNIARMEAGNQNFSVDTLQKLAEALGSNLQIVFS